MTAIGHLQIIQRLQLMRLMMLMTQFSILFVSNTSIARKYNSYFNLQQYSITKTTFSVIEGILGLGLYTVEN